jgi:hypothetical protein
MPASDNVKGLRKAGKTEEAYALGRSLLFESPDDWSLRGAFGWVLYEKVRGVVQDLKGEATAPVAGSEALHDLLLEYADLHLRRPDLLFSLIVSRLLQVADDLPWLPGLFKWAGPGAFRPEDYAPQNAEDGTSYEALVARAANAVGKQVVDGGDGETVTFAVSLIDDALNQGSRSSPSGCTTVKPSIGTARLGTGGARTPDSLCSWQAI